MTGTETPWFYRRAGWLTTTGSEVENAYDAARNRLPRPGRDTERSVGKLRGGSNNALCEPLGPARERNLPGQNTFNHPPALGPPRAEQHKVATAQIRSRAERPGGASADDALSCLCASDSSVFGGTTSSRSCRPEAMLRTI